MANTARLFLIGLACLVLTACGGGGDDGGAAMSRMWLSLLLAMPARAAILFFLFVFEYQDFIVFSLRFQSARYRGSLHDRLTDIGFGFSLHKKHILEFHWGTLLHIQLLNADYIPFRNAVLFSAGHYNCIHGLTSWGEIGDLTKKSAKRQ